MPVWDAEIVIDELLVRTLLAEQFPDLDAASVQPLAEGWDNAVWIVEEEWAFRFPRRGIAIPGVERELTVLQRLAPLLPSPIPVPTFVGRPSERFPWPFFGAPVLHGREPADADLTESARVELGAALGSFLRVLHAPETQVQVQETALPVDPLGRADMAIRVPRARESLAEVASSRIWSPPALAERILDQASDLPRPAEQVLVHGDLHFRHVLIDRGALAGVIDWGDVCVGDPAIDLQLAWSFLPPVGRERLLDEYGSIDEERRLRARVLALNLCAVLALYGRHEALANVEREAVAGLERALVDWG